MRQLVEIGFLSGSDVNIVHGDHRISVGPIDHHSGLPRTGLCLIGVRSLLHSERQSGYGTKVGGAVVLAEPE